MRRGREEGRGEREDGNHSYSPSTVHAFSHSSYPLHRPSTRVSPSLLSLPFSRLLSFRILHSRFILNCKHGRVISPYLSHSLIPPYLSLVSETLIVWGSNLHGLPILPLNGPSINNIEMHSKENSLDSIHDTQRFLREEEFNGR